MIGAIIGAAASLGSGIYGGIKSAKAVKKQKQLIDGQQTQNDAWYNRNYYKNYLDSSEARAAIKRVEDTMKKRNKEVQATAAITGATPENVLAQQENNQKLMSNTVGNLAARSDMRKEQVDAVNQQNQQNIMNMKMGQLQANEAGGSQVMNNGLGLINSALSLYDNNKKQKS